MYVVKVGEYYVSYADVNMEYINDYNVSIWVGEIKLSKTLQRSFVGHIASYIASVVNGEVIGIKDEVTNE